MSVIEQIGLFAFGNTQLFYDEARVGKEVSLNLASFPGTKAGFTSEYADLLIDALQKAIVRMEIALGAVLNGRRGVFYMWHDKQAHLLRWTIISDVGQKRLPFSSNVNEVDIKTVVKEWGTPVDDPCLPSIDEIKKEPAVDLRTLIRAMGYPTINAYVRKVNGGCR